MIANIALDDGLILPHGANPTGSIFRERQESRKAEEVFGDWNIKDIESKEDIWKKNGGEIITMSGDESKRYIDALAPVVPSILSANPKVKEDYEALLATAKRYR